MRAPERLQAVHEGGLEGGGDVGVAQGLGRDRLHGGERVLDPVGQLVGQQRPALVVAVAVRVVAQDLEEALQLPGAAAQGHQRSHGPEAGAVGPQVPALVLGVAVLRGPEHLGLDALPGAVLRREDDIGVAPEDFLLRVAEEAPRARVPGRDAPLQVEGEDRVLRRALDDEPQVLLVPSQTLPLRRVLPPPVVALGEGGIGHLQALGEEAGLREGEAQLVPRAPQRLLPGGEAGLGVGELAAQLVHCRPVGRGIGSEAPILRGQGVALAAGGRRGSGCSG